DARRRAFGDDRRRSAASTAGHRSAADAARRARFARGFSARDSAGAGARGATAAAADAGGRGARFGRGEAGWWGGGGGDVGGAGEPLAVPPAIPELRRRLLLTQLVMRWGQVRGQPPLLPGQAAALAASLARFLDTVATEGANFARLADLVPQDLAAHWQIVHKFLE